jgi:hypothetical protein
MLRVAVTVAAVALLCGCGNPGPVSDRNAVKTSPAAQPASPSPLASPSPVSAYNSLLVFVLPGTVSLVRPDGTVVSTMSTQMNSGELARYQFDVSNAALIGPIWGPGGQQLSTASLSLYHRDGTMTPLAPAAAEHLNSADIFNSAIAVDGHNILVVDSVSPTSTSWRYVKLDLTSGAVTVLLTATWSPPPLPPGALDGPLPSSANITPLGTNRDGSVARLMVTDVVVDGTTVRGQAYFEIDLRTLRVTGPHALPNVGPIAISADGRYIAWSELRVVSGNGLRDLHIRDLTTGHETTVAAVPFANEAAHGGIRFSPDNSFVALEGYGERGMGIAVYDIGGRPLTQIFGARPNDAPLDNVPLWWTDAHTIVYQTTDAGRATRSGHRLDVITGSVSDYPAELGAPVLMLAG